MNRGMKRVLSWLLIICLVLSFSTNLQPVVKAEGDQPTILAQSTEGQVLQSPVIGTRNASGAEVTFNYQGAEADARVIVKGEFYNNWAAIDLDKGADNTWSVSRQIEAGWYAYGLATYDSNGKDDWKRDPLNTTVIKDGNPGLSVPGIKINMDDEVQIGTSTVINAVYYTGDKDVTEKVQLNVTDSSGNAISGITVSDVGDGKQKNLIIDSAVEPGTIKIEGIYDTWTLTKTVNLTKNKLTSPVINGDGTVTFNSKYTGETLYLVGAMNDWHENDAIPLTKKDGVFSLTIPLSPGTYEYKFIPTLGSWSGDMLDSLNPNKSNGNSLAIVPGIIINSDSTVETGSQLDLKASLQKADGTKESISPTWSLKEAITGVSLTNDKLIVEPGVAAGQKVTVIATYDGNTSQQEISIVEKMNSYTINYYRYDHTAKDWNLWLWPDGVGGKGFKFTHETSDGFAQGTFKFTESSLNIIPRLSTADKEWAAQDSQVKASIQNGNSVEVWLVEGLAQVFYSKPDVEAIKPAERSIRFDYVREDGQFDGWNIWTWNTGKSDGEVKFTKINGNTATATIPIGSTVQKIGFKIRKGTDWVVIDQDYDREIITGTQVLTKVVVQAGQGPFRTLPSAMPPHLEDGKATFTYRDQTLFEQDKMDTIDRVELKINGSTYLMQYNANDELYEYTLNSLTEGTHEYTFLVTKDGVTTELSDPTNIKDGKSVITYKRTNVSIQSEVKPSAISYNENAVLGISLSGIAEDEIRQIYANLSSLGGKSEVKIDIELKALTIAVKDSVSAGIKSIPVTVIDVYGNKHTQTAQVTVKTRQTVGKDDFDWDEARIYFMLTDRFFNGDSTNDDPNGEGYDKSHLESYHGGDFKGITKKIGYLKDLGINTIWITPIVDNIDFNKGVDFGGTQYAYHGYWAKDFTTIDEHLGDLNDFKQLLDTAHDNGIKVMVDVVLNHTGYGMDKLTPAWVTNGVTNLPTDAERGVFNGMLRSENEDPIIRNNVAGLPDLITEDPAVREQIVAWQSDWIEKSKTSKGNTIDYFRVDTIKHVEDTTWMDFKNVMTSINPAFKMIGENFGASVDNDGGYLRSGTMDSELDFAFKGIAREFVDGNIESAEQKLQSRNGKLDNTATMGQFLSSHDEDGFLISTLSETDRVKFKNGTLDAEVLRAAQGKQKVAASLQITSKGQPVIYYGEELGQSGLNANFDIGRYSDNRYDFNWNGLSDPTYNHIYDHYKKMLSIRGQYSQIFSKGTRESVAGSNVQGYDVFSRTYEGKSVYVGINTKTEAQQVTFKIEGSPNTKFVDQYSKVTIESDEEGQITFTLPSNLDGGTVVLTEKTDSPGTTPTPSPTPTPTPSPGSSSNSSSSSNAQPSATPSKSAESSSTLEVVAKTGANGNKEVEVSAASLEQAIAAAAKKNEPVTIHVTGVTAGESVDVILPADVLKKAESQNVGLQLQLPDGVVKLPSGAIDSGSLNQGGRAIFSKNVVAADKAEELKRNITALDGAYRPLSAIYDFSVSVIDGLAGTPIHINLNGPFTIELNLDQATLNSISNKNKVGVYLIGDDGSLQYLGGKLKDGTLTFQSDRMGQFIVMEYNKVFSDVKPGWAKEFIGILAAKHIATGKDTDRFDPKGNVTRGQFAALLGRALGLKADMGAGSGTNASALADVQEDSYYRDYVTMLNKMGIISGYPDGTFRPDELVTREQITTMLMKAYTYVTAHSLQEIAGINEESFTDIGEASSYAQESIKAAKALGIIQGTGQNKFQPSTISTREQVAAMIVLWLEQVGL
ncbi:alpha-amylase family glycosyl hydrolase [Paenibacillus segetis]|uniref:SLH domain-containing protein n=1 Tax=Paenibacillus segetis TaxID=1325360 RepID=A0ABQ1Y5H8_9BACL|nr:alpha-amylase family glycosyl hydrolase [Paenibacillus segetis]GGH12020.1 hypothetical protein GCM10008013_04190 [Paenibacillus segetis]